MNEQKAAEIILKELEQVSLFSGKYDAKNGKKDFMYGILTVIEYIASFVDEEKSDIVSNNFIENMIKSEENKKK